MAHKRKLTDEQIVAVVKQMEAGRTAAWSRTKPCGCGIWKTKTASEEAGGEGCLDREMLKALLIKNRLSS